MYGILTVAQKEWLDALRDRRAIFSTLFYSILGPLLIFMMLKGLAVEEGADIPVQLAISGYINHPQLVDAFEGRGFDVTIENDVLPHGLVDQYDAVLVIPDTFGDSLKRGRTGQLELYVDPATDSGSRAVERIRAVISSFSGSEVRSRLLVHGVNPALVNPVDMQIRNTGENSAITIVITRLLVLFFIMAPFFASLNVASDVTAVERAKEALQSLLTQPVNLWSLVIGKWLVTFSIGAVAVTSMIVAASFVINNTPTTEIGVLLYMPTNGQLLILLILLPFVGLVASLQMAIGLLARSYKEAQTYLSLLSFSPIVIGFTAVFKQDFTPEISYSPIAHQLGLLQRVLMNQALDMQLALSGGVITGVIAILGLAICVSRYRNERLLRN